MISKNSRIFIAGHKGLLGSSVLRILRKKKYKNLIFIEKKKLDLRNQSKVFKFLKNKKPDVVINCAGKVGGIKANYLNGAEFIYDNLTIQNNLIHSSYLNNIKKFIFMGSSCIYPKNAKQPLKEKYLLTAPLELTNESYAVSKIAGVKLCESYNRQYNTDYICLMPSNLFGPNDNYDTEDSHFLPAIIKKLYTAKNKKTKKIKFWGTGKAKRELTYVDEISEACVFFLNKKTNHTLINIGSGYERSIKSYINYIAKKIKIKSKIVFDNNKLLDGTPRKIVDTSIARSYGWKPKYNFDKSFDITFKNFKDHLYEK